MKLSNAIVFTSLELDGGHVIEVKAIVEIGHKKTVNRSLLFDARSGEKLQAKAEMVKKELTRNIIETIQPRAEFESQFAKMRDVIRESTSLSMDDQMRILKQLSDLQESLMLK